MIIMSECSGNFFIQNGELLSSGLFINSLVYEGESIYEVLRLVKGKPVFFDDHFERLSTSASLQKKLMLADSETLKNDITALAKSEKKREVNIKIVFNYNISDNYLVYLIESVYPTREQYQKGVRGSLFFAERKDPESKVINHRLRSEIYRKLVLDGAYEALLVNKSNCITEGSRSNIFFIRGDTLFTAPEEAVLSGITRKYILKLCRENGIDVKFTCIKADKISDYDSVIMTGTSPVVLPFFCIDNTYFKVNHRLITLLRNMYLVRAEESIRRFSEL
ncbi:MAG: aminotransferase class IV [Odoribacter sp.]|nr:aminotransferase class IV [Odoribacter sp.]